MNRDVWYLLVDERGQPAFAGVGADAVSFDSDVIVLVMHVRKKVWEENQRIIEGVAAHLKVYSTKDDITGKIPLKASALVGDGGGSEDMPLFVVVPKKMWKWLLILRHLVLCSRLRPIPWTLMFAGRMKSPVYSLNEAKLFFVNRSAAVEQLQKIHGFKFHRATSKEGKEWIIPIADNVIGLGKSAFGRHYIRKSRESWPTATEIGSFEKTLCDCHTIAIEFHKGALLEDTFDAVMIRFLCEALKDMFVVQPAILSKPPKTVNALLDDLTEVAGPVFIVLDEIGKAFQANALYDFEQRDQFYSFCQIILDKWLPLKNVFFVVLGRASFLNYVALRPTNAHITPSPYVFERLNIHLLRPPSIPARLELTQQTSEAVAEHLFRQTNGHPRSLLDAFESCHSVDELLQYHKPLEMLNWKEFYEKLVLNEPTVTRLLNYVEFGDTIDLTEPIDDAGKKRVTLDNIASNSFIAWEGTVLKAKLYLHPTVKMYMENYLMPFREYLEHIGNVTRVTIDFPTVFEWMFLKRFQEILFQAPNEPRLALPAFFGTPKFGNYTSVSFSMSVRPIPKITSAGSASASLDSDTARPAAWPRLLDSIGPGPICLKPLSKSASSDAFLIGSAKFGAESFVLTVGLAVKNYGTTAFSWSHLSRECFVFNRMFEGAACTGRRNILFICCTHYSSEVMAQFNRRCFFVYASDSYPNIDEVILLNLSDKNLRERFFDVGNGLSAVVESVVENAEAEYQVVT
ncbi:hypothetical protein BJ741DRAFT_646702 [Chytriomyces cf. hyalinus JEL632]|nr:hypothetical protein BJ741DRAFT_646702 [Chytriomyces cf. hyalinus JEL632]